MEQYARDKKTAEWLAMEYNATTDPFRVSIEGAETTVPWPKIQRRIAQLIKADRFYTEQEHDRFDDVDPIAIREKLEQGEESPFVRQVMADAEAVAQEQEQGAPEPAADDNTAAEWAYIERQKFLAGLDLTDEQLTIVRAMETAGFRYDPAAANPALNENYIFRDASNGYPLTYQTWDEVYDWINTAELSAYPGLREKVQGILHPDQTPPDPTKNDDAPAENTPAPEPEATEESGRDPFAPAYKVGDTVYLENTAYEITEVSEYNVQLLDPTLSYPIFRSENRTNFEVMLQQDPRNGHITEYLAESLRNADYRLQKVLTEDNGLLGVRDRELFVRWVRAGEGNTRIAQRLSETCSGRSGAMLLPNGENVNFASSANGVMLEFPERGNGKLSFFWTEIAPILRAAYQQERDAFYHDPATVQPVNLTGPLRYQVGDSVADRDITGTIGYIGDLEIRIDTGPYSWSQETVNRKYFEEAVRHDGRNAHLFQPEEREAEQVQTAPDTRGETHDADPAPTATIYPGEQNGLPYDVIVETIPTPEPVRESMPEPVQAQPAEPPAKENFRITDDNLGVGGPKAKYRMNVEAIRTLKQIEMEGRTATAAEQEILSRYVGWGGIPNTFDPDKEDWAAEYVELKDLLTEDEYRSARASTLNAHYTSPTVIKAVYEAIGNMGFENGNILEPSCGVGNFFGLLPEGMRASKLYGVELDSITGRIAQQLYPQANISIQGYEKTGYPRDFFDLAVGNVPFGQYKVADRAYDKLGFSIHNYFFAKALDQVRPGGVVAFVTSRYTLDAQDPSAREYLAKRAKLLGAIRFSGQCRDRCCLGYYFPAKERQAHYRKAGLGQSR